jgi:sporulation protein YlmC with PRC-barrel domain
VRPTIIVVASLVALSLPRLVAAQAAPEPEMSTRVFMAPFTANELIGADVVNREGENVATIADLLLDENGTLRQVVLDVGGFLGIASKPVAIDVNRLTLAEGRDGAFVLGLSKDEITALPAWDVNQWRDQPR